MQAAREKFPLSLFFLKKRRVVLIKESIGKKESIRKK